LSNVGVKPLHVAT
jgi:integrase/recombinase XerC